MGYLGAGEMTTLERRDAWAYGLVGFDVAAVLLWLPVTAVDIFAPFVLGAGHWWVLPPAVLVLLLSLGFWMLARAGPQQRDQRPLVHLKWASALVLLPLTFYPGMAFLLVAFSGF
jgi:hypothetical protein